jgi:uncharacterized protein (UPF0548 family)
LTNYGAVGGTRPADAEWTDRPAGLRSYERTVLLGAGPQYWEFATRAVLEWGIKTRSGFTVGSAGTVRSGAAYDLVAHLGPIRIKEPVTVVAVVEEPDRVGFAYGTRDGHPVRGEEAFIVHRDPDGSVHLTLRSLTSAPRGIWLLAYPVVLVAQRAYRRRYQRALR